MYKKILLTLAITCLVSCKESQVDKNTEMTIKWIENNKNPTQFIGGSMLTPYKEADLKQSLND